MRNDREYLIERMCHIASLGVIHGERASGKSLVALDMALSVASGRSWHGRPVKRGPVVYIGSDSHDELARRALAWRYAHRVPATEIDLYLICDVVDPVDTATANTLRRCLRKLNPKPVLTIVDTPYPCRDRDDDHEAVATLRRIIDEIGTTIFIITPTRSPMPRVPLRRKGRDEWWDGRDADGWSRFHFASCCVRGGDHAGAPRAARSVLAETVASLEGHAPPTGSNAADVQCNGHANLKSRGHASQPRPPRSRSRSVGRRARP